MKFNFKKIASVIATTVMLGSTVAFAAAAWPAPFVNNGAAASAVVYGANSADLAAAADLGAALDASVTSSGTLSGEGDTYLLEKTSTKLHLGNGVVDVVSSTVDDDNLPTLLADGKYIDDDNDEFDYTQKITLSNFSVTMFDDNDYKEDAPTVGVKVTSGSPMLNYTLEFSDLPVFTDLETSDLPMMGKEYYVLDVNTPTNTTITLLDSAEKVILQEGETKTITIGAKAYECSISYITSSSVKLSINGQVTNSLAVGQTYKLSDGTYVGVREVLARDVAGVTGQVEFGIGSGKLKLTNSQEVEMNDNSIPRLKSYITNSSGSLASITLQWEADGDQFIAPGSEPVMPGFENIKLTWAGFEKPSAEAITLTAGGDDYAMLDNFPLKDSTEDIYLLYTVDNANYTGIGKDANKKLVTSKIGNLSFDSDDDEYFVASWADSRDSESYLMRANGFKIQDSINKTTFQYKKDDTWTDVKTDRKAGDSVTLGNIEFNIETVDYNAKTVRIAAVGSTDFATLYSKDGLKILLPWTNSTAQSALDHTPTCAEASFKPGQIGPVNYSNTTGPSTGLICYSTTWYLNAFEENKDGDVAGGAALNLTLGFNSATTPQVSVTDVVGENVTFAEEGSSTKMWKSYLYSALATEILWDKSGDQYEATLNYNGGESKANIYLTASTVTTGAASAIKVVKDTEVDSVSSMNLVVVGGSCINTVAAKILRSETPLCGEAWSAKTGAGAGKYLVQVAASPYNAGKIAMLVAGYDAADTVSAVAKVKEGKESTDVGAVVYPLATA